MRCTFRPPAIDFADNYYYRRIQLTPQYTNTRLGNVLWLTDFRLLTTLSACAKIVSRVQSCATSTALNVDANSPLGHINR